MRSLQDQASASHAMHLSMHAMHWLMLPTPGLCIVCGDLQSKYVDTQ